MPLGASRNVMTSSHDQQRCPSSSATPQPVEVVLLGRDHAPDPSIGSTMTAASSIAKRLEDPRAASCRCTG